MSSYLKEYTHGQATRAIMAGQSGFITGMNLDLPRKEIESSSVAEAINWIPTRTGLRPRAGTRLFGTGPDGATAFHDAIPHPNGKAIAHWDNKIYISSDYNVWTEVTGTWTPADADSKIEAIGDNAVIFQADRILFLELKEGSEYLRRFNAPNPQTEPPLVAIENNDGPYVYRYTYTYARYVDDVLLTESGTFNGTDYKSYYKELRFAEPLSGAKKVKFQDVTLPTDSEDGLSTQWTHMNVYRTIDIGDNQQGNVDQYYLVQSYDLSVLDPNAAGIGEMVIQGDPIFKISDTNGDLSISDDDLLGNLLLNKLFYVPIPDSLIGSVSDGVVFVQNGTESRVNQSFTGVFERTGYYFEGSQFEEINGKLVEMVNLGSFTSVICENRTYLADNSSFERNDEIYGGDIGNSVFTLNPFTLIDSNIGVRDKGTISLIDQSRIIAVNNDGGVRIFDRSWNTTDFARDKVSTETKRLVNGSCSIFHPEGYYLLTYSKDDNETTCPNTMRRGMAEDVGTGWNFYGGEGWFNPLKGGKYIKTLYQGNLVILAFDSDNNIYWVETYDGPDGSGLTREDKDKVGGATEYDISVGADLPDMKGATEGYFVQHLKTLLSLAPYKRGDLLDSDQKISVEVFKDDDLTPTSIYYDAKNLKEIVLSEVVLGHFIHLRITINSNKTRLTKYESTLEVIDAPSPNRDNNEVLLLQEQFTENLLFSMGRGNTLYNNVKTLGSGDKSGVDTGSTSETTGPDGYLTGVKF